MTDDRGSAAVMAVVMLPLLIAIVSGVVQLGAVRVLAARITSAADLATIAAVDDQDESELIRSGSLHLAPDAEAVARAYFALNLAPVASFLDLPPEEIAARAQVAAFSSAPAIDPLTGVRYERPTVRVLAAVPVRTPVFGSLLLAPTFIVNVRAASSPR